MNKIETRRLFIYIGLIVVLMISILAISNWSGLFNSNNVVYAEWVGKGSGTEQDPYITNSYVELQKFDYIVNGTNGETRNENICGNEADILSEFAFVSKTASADNGSINVEDNAPHGFCVGWVAFIVVVLELLYLGLYVIVKLKAFKPFMKKIKLDVLYNKVETLLMIGLFAGDGLFLFALIALTAHVCAISIASFVFALAVCALFSLDYMYGKNIIKKPRSRRKKAEETK